MTGFLAHFFVAWQQPTQGDRSCADPPETWPALTMFSQRLAEIMDQPDPIDEDGALSLTMIPLATDINAASM